jgi:hypothetical protein
VQYEIARLSGLHRETVDKYFARATVKNRLQATTGLSSRTWQRPPQLASEFVDSRASERKSRRAHEPKLYGQIGRLRTEVE